MSANFRLRPVLGLAAFLLGTLPASVHAGTGTVSAQASVDTYCTVATSALTFGPYDPIQANVSANLDNGTTASVTVTCVKGSNATIALGNGSNFLTGSRRMKHASKASFLTYELYKPPSLVPNAACSFPGSSVWNATSPLVPGSAPDKNSRRFNVCGTVPAGQDVEAGTYSDTVVVTVNF